MLYPDLRDNIYHNLNFPDDVHWHCARDLLPRARVTRNDLQM